MQNLLATRYKSHFEMMLLLIAFGVLHSGLASLRPQTVKIIGERAYRYCDLKRNALLTKKRKKIRLQRIDQRLNDSFPLTLLKLKSHPLRPVPSPFSQSRLCTGQHPIRSLHDRLLHRTSVRRNATLAHSGCIRCAGCRLDLYGCIILPPLPRNFQPPRNHSHLQTDVSNLRRRHHQNNTTSTTVGTGTSMVEEPNRR